LGRARFPLYREPTARERGFLRATDRPRAATVGLPRLARILVSLMSERGHENSNRHKLAVPNDSHNEGVACADFRNNMPGDSLQQPYNGRVSRTVSSAWITAGLMVVASVSVLVLTKGVSDYPSRDSSARIIQSPVDGSGLMLPKLIQVPAGVVGGHAGLLVLMGQCLTCSKEKYQPGSEYGRYDYVLEVQDTQAAEEPRRLGPSLWILADRDGKLHRMLNCFFPPRAYLLDGRGRIMRSETGLARDALFRRS